MPRLEEVYCHLMLKQVVGLDEDLFHSFYWRVREEMFNNISHVNMMDMHKLLMVYFKKYLFKLAKPAVSICLEH